VHTNVATVRAGAKKKAKAEADKAASGGEGGEPADPAAAVYKIPELASLGRAFRSTPEVALTETEMEYVVTCVKHVFETHVVLQFSVLNTLDEQRLKDVIVNVTVGEPDFYVVDMVVPASVAKYGEQASCYVALKRLGDAAPTGLSCQLAFKVVTVDPTTGEADADDEGYDEEYPLEDMELLTHDFMAKRNVGDFRRNWEQMDTEGEVEEKFALQFKKLEEAVLAVTDLLGMLPADGTGIIASGDGSKRQHSLHLSGTFVGNVPILARVKLQMDDASGVILKIAVRSPSKDISQLICNCIS
jgi:coatomer protein complex subunit gamma